MITPRRCRPCAGFGAKVRVGAVLLVLGGLFMGLAQPVLAQPVLAQPIADQTADLPPPQGATFAVGIGTGGLLAEARFPTSAQWGWRLVGSFGQIDVPTTLRGTRFDVGVDLGGVGLMLDYAPGAGAFFLTGGLMRPSMGFSAYRDDVAYQLVDDGQDYIGTVGFDASPRHPFAAVVGIGMRRGAQARTRGWHIAAEAGLVITGPWRGWVEADTDTPMLGGIAQIFRDELAEANDRFNDRLADVPVVPYLTLSVARRF